MLDVGNGRLLTKHSPHLLYTTTPQRVPN
jgi:hypothetical protein